MSPTTKIILASAGVLYLLTQGVKNIKIIFNRIDISEIDLGLLRLNINLYVKNPLPISFNISDIAGDIYIQDVNCGKIDYPVNQTLRGLSTSEFNVSFNIKQEQLGEALFANIMTGDVKTLTCRFVGYVKFGKVKVKVDHKFGFKDIFRQYAS